MSLFVISAGFLGTILAYILSKQLAKKYPIILFSPLILCPIILIAIIVIFNIDYAQYDAGAHFLTKLLGPATVAFAVPIYKHYALIKKYMTVITISLTIGVIVAFASSYLFALLFGISSTMATSLIPRSITTPIAMDISTLFGGEPNMTAVFVIITGLGGSIIGPSLIRFLHIRTAAAKGLMLGMGAHGAGTSAAFTLGELEGTFSSLAMILAALVSIILSEALFI